MAASERAERAWLRTARESRGLSRRQLAERLKVREETVESWERGANVPRHGKREPLAAELGMTVGDLEKSLGVAPGRRRPPHLHVLNPPAKEDQAAQFEHEAGRDQQMRHRLLDVVASRLEGDRIDATEFERLLQVAFELGGLQWPLERSQERTDRVE